METNKEMQWLSKISLLMNALLSATVLMGILIIYLAFSYASKLKSGAHIMSSKKETLHKVREESQVGNEIKSTEKLNKEVSSTSESKTIESDINKPIVTYYLVAASMTDKKSTERVIAKLKNQVKRTRLIEDKADGKSMFRVCVFEANNLEDARKKREELISQGIETWVLKKNI